MNFEEPISADPDGDLSLLLVRVLVVDTLLLKLVAEGKRVSFILFETFSKHLLADLRDSIVRLYQHEVLSMTTKSKQKYQRNYNINNKEMRGRERE